MSTETEDALARLVDRQNAKIRSLRAKISRITQSLAELIQEIGIDTKE